MPNQRRLLWVCDLEGTGYSTGSQVLLNRFISKHKDEFDVHFLFINHTYDMNYVVNSASKNYPGVDHSKFHTIKIHDWMPRTNDSIQGVSSHKQTFTIETLLGLHELDNCIMSLKPDMVISINDNTVLENHVKIVRNLNEREKMNVKLIPYIPIDVEAFPSEKLKFLNNCEKILTMTQFCKNVFLNSGVKKPITVLYHPMEIDKYYPLDKEARLEARKRILNIGDGVEDTFIILNCNKNQNRKRIDLTLEGFAKWVQKTNKKVGEVMLLLKMTEVPSAVGGGVHVKDVIEFLSGKYNIQLKDYIALISKKLPQETLNELYNLSDAGINTTSGEGFGIIPAECALTLQPQIIPNSGTYPELFDGIGLVDAEQTSYGEGRLCKNMNKLANESFIFYKSYASYQKVQNQIVSEIEFEKDEHMVQYLVSANGRDTHHQKQFSVNAKDQDGKPEMVFSGHFRTLKYLQSWLNKSNSPPVRFQVFLNYGKDFTGLREQLHFIRKLNDAPFLTHDNRSNHQLSKGKFNTMMNEWDVKVSVCKLDSLVQTIDKIYSEVEYRKMLAEKGRKSIQEKCNPDVITEQFYNFLKTV